MNADHSQSPAMDPVMLVVLAIAALALSQIVFILTGDGFLSAYIFPDPDPYKYFNRVELLQTGTSWFDKTDPRISPPDGLAQHWGRPLDLIFWAGASALALILPFRDALALFGAAWSPLLHFTLLAIAIWAFRPFGKSPATAAAAIAVLQIPVFVLFRWGQANHNSLLLLLWVVAMGAIFRQARYPQLDARAATTAGVILGLAMWVNLAALILVLLCFALIGLLWLQRPAFWHRFGATFSLALTITLVAAGLAEWGTQLWTVTETDVIGMPILIALAAATGFWFLISACTSHANILSRSVTARLITAAAAASATLLAIISLAPELLAGPYAETTELYQTTRLNRLPLHNPAYVGLTTTAEAWSRFAGHFALPLLGLALTIGQLKRTDPSDPDAPSTTLWPTLAITLFLCLGASIYQLRWSPYANFLAALPIATAAPGLLKSILARVGPPLVSLFRPVLHCALVFWPTLLTAAGLAVIAPLASDTSGSATTAESTSPVLASLSGTTTDADDCDLRPLATWLADQDYPPDTVAMIVATRGPEWIFRTGLRATAIGSHRPQSGFELTHQVFSSTDPNAAAQTLRDRQIDLVLVCPLAPEPIWRPPESTTNTYESLLTENPPQGLQLLLAGPAAGHWKLYEVR